jgi:outer membrane protein assembly factor BamB
MSNIVASPVICKDSVLAATSESKMVLIDATSGITIWEKDIGTTKTPAVHGDWAFILTTDNTMICTSMQDGSIKWINDIKVNNFKANKWSAPLLINGDIVSISDQGDMLYLDAFSGVLKRKIIIEKMKNAKTPIIVKGKMFVISENGKLYCIG